MPDQEIQRLQEACRVQQEQMTALSAALAAARDELASEVTRHAQTRRGVMDDQRALRRLATELSLAEERERRQIASDLHDHLGQALAFIKVQMLVFQGNEIFSGSSQTMARIIALLDQSIQYTRTLTCEISPPVLYELGLGPALSWLADDFQQKQSLTVEAKVSGQLTVPEDLRVVVFKSVRELLFNVTRHAGVDRAWLAAHLTAGRLEIEVGDQGCGVDPARARNTQHDSSGFGLFSIRERLSAYGGSFEFNSRPGQGTIATIAVQIPSEEPS